MYSLSAAPVTFNVLLSGDADPRDKKLDGSRLSATSGKTESMGTTTAEPQVVPEKKMRRADGAILAENEDETNAINSGLDSKEMKSGARRSDEARARKNAKDYQRRRAQKANIKSSQNKTEVDGAQEAEETDGPGKCGNSSEHSHGPTKL